MGGCKSAKITREQIEWSDFWWENETDNSKPRILLIGSSITRSYFPFVSKELSGIANCDRITSSRNITDPTLLKETKIVMGKYRLMVIHFNNGLHGRQLTSSKYEKQLTKYVRFLKSHKAKGCKLLPAMIVCTSK